MTPSPSLGTTQDIVSLIGASTGRFKGQGKEPKGGKQGQRKRQAGSGEEQGEERQRSQNTPQDREDVLGESSKEERQVLSTSLRERL